MKKFLAAALAVLLLAFSGCGEPAAAEIDMAALSAELLEDAGFTDIMSELDAQFASVLYGIDEADVAACRIYCGTGATAEEIAIFKAVDEQAAARISAAAGARRDAQAEAYAGYVPEEVPKLDAAVIFTSGLFVIYVVSGDGQTAEKIVSRAAG